MFVWLKGKKELVPSGLVSSLRVGRDMKVWDTECVGFWIQAMSLAWQDFMQRMVSDRWSLCILKNKTNIHTQKKKKTHTWPLTFRYHLFKDFTVNHYLVSKAHNNRASLGAAHCKNSVGQLQWPLHKQYLNKTAGALDIALNIKNNQILCGLEE